MKIISNTLDFVIDEKTAVAIGKFDGLHRGHQKLLNAILEEKENKIASAIFTFDPPASTFFGGADMKELTTKLEKRQMFEALGIDYLVEFPLNNETAAMEPETFIKEILVKKMNAVKIVAGADLSYGKGGVGDSKLLNGYANEFGYEVSIIDKVCFENREISSSYIREEVIKGNMELVKNLLGAPYIIYGKVVTGNQLGRKLNMPTVNLAPESDKLLPPNGVYYSTVTWNDKKYNAITNIGYKPTVSNTKILGVETHLYDFNENIYGEHIKVELIYFKRPELKFEKIEELKEQLDEDLMLGREFFKSGN